MPINRPSVRVAQVSAARRRKMRRPQHPFQLRHRAFQIQPFFIAPVLPGETMETLLIQSRVVTDPINNALTGWWLEYYFFYVKLNDLNDREEFIDGMILNPAWVDDNVDAGATSVPMYTYQGAVDYVSLCLERVVECYFRDADEDATAGVLDGLPMAHAGKPGWMDSIIMASDWVTEDVTVTVGGDDSFTMSEIAAAQQQWELLRAGNLTSQTYPEFLATYGVRAPKIEEHKPELIRYLRDWQYPSNTIDPTNGVPRSAVSWSSVDSADKNRYFKEPGFLFAVTVVRPKVYYAAQLGNMAGAMNHVKAWLPAVLSDDPNSSFKAFTDAAGGGPFGAGMSEAYYADIKDLFIYGDQFIGLPLDATGANLVSLPDADGQRRYVADADVDSLFVTPATLQNIKQDGIVSLTIASTLHDTSDVTGSVA